jgi:spermidine synthase
VLLALLAGCAGMMIETVLLLHYQLKQGALFEDLGVLLAAFMGGLAVGAAAARWLGVVRDSVGARREVARWWGAALAAAFVLLAATVGLLVRAGVAGGLLWVALLLAASGFSVAALFAYASLQHVTDQQAVISPLYAADLLGGCVGSIGATLILIPLAGLAVTADWTAVLAGLMLFLI